MKLEEIKKTAEHGYVLIVSGADMMDGTPIFDIKPYLPYADCHPEATGGFTQTVERRVLEVECPPQLLEVVAEDRRQALLGVLANDPRPSYQHDPERIYGMEFADVEVRFSVQEERLRVHEIHKKDK